MKPSNFVLLVFVLLTVISNYTFAHILDRPPAPVKRDFREPQEVIKQFLEAVNRGELIVFDKKVDQDMLIPLRVEYVYELDSAIPTVKVYSELKQPIPIPDQENCELRGIGAILDTEGHIIEIEAYIRSH